MMTFVTLNDDQARLIGEATSPIVLLDANGREVGTVSPTPVDNLGPDATEEEVVAEIKRRMATHDGTFRLYSDLVKQLRERFAG
jgi:hypothetical protein